MLQNRMISCKEVYRGVNHDTNLNFGTDSYLLMLGYSVTDYDSFNTAAHHSENLHECWGIVLLTTIASIQLPITLKIYMLGYSVTDYDSFDTAAHHSENLHE